MSSKENPKDSKDPKEAQLRQQIGDWLGIGPDEMEYALIDTEEFKDGTVVITVNYDGGFAIDDRNFKHLRDILTFSNGQLLKIKSDMLANARGPGYVNVIATVPYRNGQKNGEEVRQIIIGEVGINGSKASMSTRTQWIYTTWENDLKHGLHRSFDDTSDEPLGEGHYVNGMKEGMWVEREGNRREARYFIAGNEVSEEEYEAEVKEEIERYMLGDLANIAMGYGKGNM